MIGIGKQWLMFGTLLLLGCTLVIPQSGVQVYSVSPRLDATSAVPTRKGNSSQPAQKTPPAVDTAVTPAATHELITVMVELTEPPVASAAKQPLATPLGHAINRLQTLFQWMRVYSAQQTLIQQLSTSPIEAKVISRTMLTLNSITIQVSADKVGAIRQMPGVKAVHMNMPLNKDGDNSITPPETGSSTQ